MAKDRTALLTDLTSARRQAHSQMNETGDSFDIQAILAAARKEGKISDRVIKMLTPKTNTINAAYKTSKTSKHKSRTPESDTMHMLDIEMPFKINESGGIEDTEPSMEDLDSPPVALELDPESAASRVFTTYELVEQILLQVSDINRGQKTNIISRESMKTILLAQRINPTCYHVIQRSAKLQEELFFKPTSQSRTGTTQTRYYYCNPLLEGRGLLERGFIKFMHPGPRHGTYFDPPSIFARQGYRENKISPQLRRKTRKMNAKRQSNESSQVVESWEKMLPAQTDRVRRIDFRLVRPNGNLGTDTKARPDSMMGELWKLLLEKEAKDLAFERRFEEERQAHLERQRRGLERERERARDDMREQEKERALEQETRSRATEPCACSWDG